MSRPLCLLPFVARYVGVGHQPKCSERASFVCFLLRERTPPGVGRNQRHPSLGGPASREGAGRTGRAGRAKAQQRGAPNREPRRLLSQVGKWKGDSQDPNKPAPVSRILDAREFLLAVHNPNL
jgi:hypothetical protein